MRCGSARLQEKSETRRIPLSSQGDKPWTCYGVAPEPLCTFNPFVAPSTPRLMSQLLLKDGNFVEDADLDTEPGGDGCF